jgi:hypothetical protein
VSLQDSIEDLHIPSSEEVDDELKNRERVMKATQLVLAGAVNSKIREDHIEVIQSLDEATQESLMLCIQEIMTDSTAETPQKDQESRRDANDNSSPQCNDTPYSENSPANYNDEKQEQSPDSTTQEDFSPGARVGRSSAGSRSSFGGTSLLDNEFDMITKEW